SRDAAEGGIRLAAGDVKAGAVVQRSGQDAAARLDVGGAVSVAAQIIGLEILQVGDVIDFAGVGNRARAARDAQVIWLLFVSYIAPRDVPADDQGEIACGEIGLKGRQV